MHSPAVTAAIPWTGTVKASSSTARSRSNGIAGIVTLVTLNAFHGRGLGREIHFGGGDPGTRLRAFSTRIAHEAHVMPSMGSLMRSIASSYGERTAAFVALTMEYPWRNEPVMARPR